MPVKRAGFNITAGPAKLILQTLQNGHLKYEKVIPYNQKWLPKDSQGRPTPPGFKESFDPASTWVEDRWILCRRISGDKICRVLFFHLCTFIWEHNGFSDNLKWECQKCLVEYVFKAGDVREFSKNLKEPVPVMTWDRRMMVWMTSKQINDMFLETCLIGPLAAMFGREFQQYLLTHKKEDMIPCSEIEYSVNSGRTSLSDERISTVRHCKVDKDRDEESFAQSERTRSPRRTPHAEPYKRSTTSNRYFDIREPQWPVRDDRDRDYLQEGSRGQRVVFVRDLIDSGNRDYYDRNRARGSDDRTREPLREPRPYTKRPRSPDRQNKERPHRYA